MFMRTTPRGSRDPVLAPKPGNPTTHLCVYTDPSCDVPSKRAPRGSICGIGHPLPTMALTPRTALLACADEVLEPPTKEVPAAVRDHPGLRPRPRPIAVLDLVDIEITFGADARTLLWDCTGSTFPDIAAQFKIQDGDARRARVSELWLQFVMFHIAQEQKELCAILRRAAFMQHDLRTALYSILRQPRVTLASDTTRCQLTLIAEDSQWQPVAFMDDKGATFRLSVKALLHPIRVWTRLASALIAIELVVQDDPRIRVVATGTTLLLSRNRTHNHLADMRLFPGLVQTESLDTYGSEGTVPRHRRVTITSIERPSASMLSELARSPYPETLGKIGTLLCPRMNGAQLQILYSSERFQKVLGATKCRVPQTFADPARASDTAYSVSVPTLVLPSAEARGVNPVARVPMRPLTSVFAITKPRFGPAQPQGGAGIGAGAGAAARVAPHPFRKGALCGRQPGRECGHTRMHTKRERSAETSDRRDEQCKQQRMRFGPQFALQACA